MSPVTNCYEKLQRLSAIQENALELVMRGMRDGDVADSVGVHRVTVTRWRNSHPAFRAELNRRRQDLRSASKQQLEGLLPLALDAIASELVGDSRYRFKAAIEVLKLIGVDRDPISHAPIEAIDLIEQSVNSRLKERLAVAQREQTDLDRLYEDVHGGARKEREERIAAEVRQEVLTELSSLSEDEGCTDVLD